MICESNLFNRNCYCRSCNPLQRHRNSENTPLNFWDSRLRGNEAGGSVNKLVVLACPAICPTMSAKKKSMAVFYCFYCTYCGNLRLCGNDGTLTEFFSYNLKLATNLTTESHGVFH